MDAANTLARHCVIAALLPTVFARGPAPLFARRCRRLLMAADRAQGMAVFRRTPSRAAVFRRTPSRAPRISLPQGKVSTMGFSGCVDFTQPLLEYCGGQLVPARVA
jgi:hypothetical protein